MENENSLTVYALTEVHKYIAPAIYSGAGVCSPDEFVELENVSPDDYRVRWKKALWDTGATQSCISDRLAEELGLEVDGFVDVATAMGIVRLSVYTIHLVLPSRLVFNSIQAIGFTYGDDDCDLIIGMDIMTQGDLSLTNMEGRTVFSFRIPSLHVVDFEAEHSR
ncbi:MAG: retroviral-like aspartic protease family protein [Saprospiraceae bacterium]